MDIDLFDLYKNILNAQGIQYLFIYEPSEELKKLDYGFREKIYGRFDYGDYVNHMISNLNDSHIIFFRDDFQLNYCFFEMPQNMQEEYHAKYVLLGPVIYRYISNTELERVMQEHHLPISFGNDVLEFYNRISTLPSQDFWISLLLPLLRPLFGSTNNYEFIDLSDNTNPEFHSTNASTQVTETGPSFDAIDERYKAEDQLFAAVTNGNVDEAVEQYHKFRQFNLTPRSPDRLRNQKNWLVILNTGLKRAVRMAQVHPYYIDELSREFAIKIESTNNIPQLENMSIIMLRKYAMLAHNYSTRHYSALVKKCMEQIHFNYQDSLSLDILAKYCAVTPSYLSNQFRKELGVTVTEYIHKVRIQHAIQLLNSTQDSIQDIASQCGFPDSNYFTRTFKKCKGITPNAYRKSLKQ